MRPILPGRNGSRVTLGILIGGFMMGLALLAAEGPGSLHAVLELVPKPESLGSGWQRELLVVMDPSSRPSELLHPTQQISEGTLGEWRRMVRDTNGNLSGWCHARFDYEAKHQTNRYYLRVEHYRSPEALRREFTRMAASQPARSPQAVKGVGEDAVVRDEDGGLTLWFRRGEFRASVTAYGGGPSGVGSLRYLALEVDRRLRASIP